MPSASVTPDTLETTAAKVRRILPHTSLLYTRKKNNKVTHCWKLGLRCFLKQVFLKVLIKKIQGLVSYKMFDAVIRNDVHCMPPSHSCFKTAPELWSYRYLEFFSPKLHNCATFFQSQHKPRDENLFALDHRCKVHASIVSTNFK